MSGHIASQTSKRPACQGASVTPSGLFPSDLNRPVGSSLEGTWAAVRPRFTISLSTTCRRCLPSLHLQLSACLPKALTSAEQCWQRCGPQTGAPRRRHTATLIVSSSIRRPRADTGKAPNQAPDSLVDTASRHERSSSFSAHPVSVVQLRRSSHNPMTSACKQRFPWGAGNRVLPTSMTVLRPGGEQGET